MSSTVRAGYITLAKNELHLLLGLFAMMYKAGQEVPDKGGFWVFAAQKLTANMIFAEEEVDLIKMAVDKVIERGQKALESIGEDRADARIRAKVVEQTYRNIKEKLEHVVYREQSVNQSKEDISGNNQEREDANNNSDLGGAGSSGSSSADPSPTG